MEHIIYILGTAIGISISLFLYRRFQLLAMQFFLGTRQEQESFSETYTPVISPLRIVFFWITHIPLLLTTHLPPKPTQPRIYMISSLLFGSIGLFFISFLSYILYVHLLQFIPIVSQISILIIQIQIITACISLLPIPPLDGARMLALCISPVLESKVLTYQHVFPIVVILASIVDALSGLHSIPRVLSFLIDGILIVFQLLLLP